MRMSKRGFGILAEDLAGLSDDELEAALQLLLGDGARTEAKIVAHLAEVEGRRLHLRAGYPSLFQYCLDVLKLSESEAFYRIAAARAVSAFPAALMLLESRQVHLSAICMLRPHLTQDNHQELLADACGKSKRQVEMLLARRFPERDIESKSLGCLKPIAEDRFRFEVIVTAQQKEQLELARDLISHANPGGGWTVV